MMFHPDRFKGKVAVVTGAAQGIGRSVAVNLAKEGGKVALVDRSEVVEETCWPLAPNTRTWTPDSSVPSALRRVPLTGRPCCSVGCSAGGGCDGVGGVGGGCWPASAGTAAPSSAALAITAASSARNTTRLRRADPDLPNRTRCGSPTRPGGRTGGCLLLHRVGGGPRDPVRPRPPTKCS